MQFDDLRSLSLFEGMTDEQLGELLSAGDEVAFAEGVELFHEGAPADFWWLLLDGSFDLVRRSGREGSVVLRTVDGPGTWAGGFQAWHENGNYLATGRGNAPGRMFRVPSKAFGALARSWFPFGVHLINGFFQTVLNLEAMSRQRESLIALGTLAAGLAHEINNPASATARAVVALQDTSDSLLASLVRLAERSLAAEHFVAIETLRAEIDTSSASADPIALADSEDALLGWLEGHSVDHAWRLAPALATAGVDVGWCDRLAAALDRVDTLGPAFDWVVGTLSHRALLAEMKESTSRITALVESVKSYSQVDRAALQHVDVTEGIESTLVMLHHKLRDAVVVVEREYGADVGPVEANPGELNQVWTNLLDNAIDAMEGGGTLTISTRTEGDHLVVDVGDTGQGMPPDVQARAFDPFYTTKDVGKGTGLGLDISRRIVVDRHHGEITIDSEPGRTVVTVKLPFQRTSPS